jgi:hypothetical protein
MFLDNSRYAKVPQEETKAPNGRSVIALRLRALPPTNGAAYDVKQNDRLDLLAHEKYADGARFWHIADANTALEASDLTGETGAELNLPET